MTSHTTAVEVHITDLDLAGQAKDAVAQQQPDRRVVVAVRPGQSFPHAVEKVKEAVERARGTTITAEEVRQLLRPHWPEDLRGGFSGPEQRQQAAPGSPQRRRTDWPEPENIPDAPEPVSVRVPLRRRNVQLGVLFAGFGLLGAGFLLGWAASDTRLLMNGYSGDVDASLWDHEMFGVFAERGASCTVTSPNEASCVDINGTTLAGVASHLGRDTLVYQFFYGKGMEATFYVAKDARDLEVWAQRESAAGDLAYLVGDVLVAGEDEDEPRIAGYARVVADFYDRPVLQFYGEGPPDQVYRPQS